MLRPSATRSIPTRCSKRRGLADSPPPQPIDEMVHLEAMDEPYRVYAWDGERVLFGCPRGACLMPRAKLGGGAPAVPRDAEGEGGATRW